MSAFLGRIHYWLFNKIVWFENLEEKIIELAKLEGLDIENFKKVIEDKYGEKLPNKPLDSQLLLHFLLLSLDIGQEDSRLYIAFEFVLKIVQDRFHNLY